MNTLLQKLNGRPFDGYKFMDRVDDFIEDYNAVMLRKEDYTICFRVYNEIVGIKTDRDNNITKVEHINKKYDFTNIWQHDYIDITTLLKVINFSGDNIDKEIRDLIELSKIQQPNDNLLEVIAYHCLALEQLAGEIK